MAYEHVIFDLDGTLVDSAPGILYSLRVACEEEGIRTIVPLEVQLIGPPLQQVLRALVGEQQKGVIDQLTRSFIAHYDSTGVLQTTAFPGVEDLLAALASYGRTLYIATNKRQVPTNRIISQLSWSHYFKDVISLDSLGSCTASKADMIRHIVFTHKLQRARTIYVGDRDEDRIAAKAAQLPFLLAAWGYGCKQHCSPQCYEPR